MTQETTAVNGQDYWKDLIQDFQDDGHPTIKTNPYAWNYMPFEKVLSEDDLKQFLKIAQVLLANRVSVYDDDRAPTHQDISDLRACVRDITTYAHDRHDREFEHMLTKIRSEVDYLESNLTAKEELQRRDSLVYIDRIGKAERNLICSYREVRILLEMFQSIYMYQDLLRQIGMFTLADKDCGTLAVRVARRISP